jgi:hypothetical protein
MNRISNLALLAAAILTIACISGRASAQAPAPPATAPAPVIVYLPPSVSFYAPPQPAGTPFVGASYGFIPPSYKSGNYGPTTNYYYTAPPTYIQPPYTPMTTSYYYPSGNYRQSYANPGPYYYTAGGSWSPGYYSYYYTPGYFRY